MSFLDRFKLQAKYKSTDPDVRQLAFDIASTQLEQVGRMKGWLMMWNERMRRTSSWNRWSA